MWTLTLTTPPLYPLFWGPTKNQCNPNISVKVFKTGRLQIAGCKDEGTCGKIVSPPSHTFHLPLQDKFPVCAVYQPKSSVISFEFARDFLDLHTFVTQSLIMNGWQVGHVIKCLNNIYHHVPNGQTVFVCVAVCGDMCFRASAYIPCYRIEPAVPGGRTLCVGVVVCICSRI